MKSKALAILRICLAALFLSYYGSATLFTHTHNFEWGQVTHSHPYAPSGHHSHTASGCQTIDHLTSILLVIIVGAILFFNLITRASFPILTFKRTLSRVCFYYQLRAPPVY